MDNDAVKEFKEDYLVKYGVLPVFPKVYQFAKEVDEQYSEEFKRVSRKSGTDPTKVSSVS